jgi:hypothetical protein
VSPPRAAPGDFAARDPRPHPVGGVNARGATKLVGTAQRLTRHGYLFSAVVLVQDPEPVRAVTDTYPLLGLDWDPATVGSVADDVRGIAVDDIAAALVPRFLGLVADVVFESHESVSRSAGT